MFRTMFKKLFFSSLGLALVASAGPVAAATFEVDTALDSADPAYALCQPGAVDCSLRGAVTAANANPGADVITLPAGLYALTVGAAGEDSNLEGDLDIIGDLVIDGAGSVLDGGGLDRLFDVHDHDLELRGVLLTGGFVAGLLAEGGAVRHGGATLTLEDVVIQSSEAALGGALFQRSGHLEVTGGSTLWQNVSRSGGGAIYVAAGTASLTGAALEANRADGHGGAVAFHGAVLDVVDSVFEGNVTTAVDDGDGGALHLAAGAVTISGSQLRANVAEYPGAYFGRGGAIALGAGASLELTASELTDNVSAYFGGAVYSEGALTMTDVLVAGNTAPFRGGGLAIYGGSADLLRPTMTANVGDWGGAIYSEAAVTIDGGVLADNVAIDGGAIMSYGDDTAATLDIVDSLLTGNRAEVSGGAVLNKGGLAVAILFDSEVADNEASGGAGLANLGDASGAPYLELRQCLIAGNRAIDFAGWGDGGSGGGVSNLHGTAALYATEVVENTADHSGGGVVSTGGFQAGLLIFNRSLAAGNVAGLDGGGVWVGAAGEDDIVSRAVFNNSTISGNLAGGLGGGLFVMEDDLYPAIARAYLYSVTVAGNQGLGGPGDGVFAHRGSDVFAENTIVATAGQPDCAKAFGGAIHSRGHNLETGLTCDFYLATDQRNTAPLLDPLADYGGPTRTRRLQPASPAMDAGDPTGCDADRDGDGLTDPAPPGGDQRGVVRQGLCDVGAYERPPAL